MSKANHIEKQLRNIKHSIERILILCTIEDKNLRLSTKRLLEQLSLDAELSIQEVDHILLRLNANLNA